MELFDTQAFAQIPGQMALETDVVTFEVGRRTLAGRVTARPAGGAKVTVWTVEGEYTVPVSEVQS